MKERIAIIIGGTGGIGAYIVEAFTNEGYKTIFTYCNGIDKANELAKKTGAESYKLDSSNEAEVADFSNYITQKYGYVNTIIYGTGIFEDSVIMDMELASWNNVVSKNMTGAFLVGKHFTELLRKTGNGRYIGIGSVVGDLGSYGSASYAASKAGLIGFVKSFALENAKYGVTANVVSLGYIDAGMTARLSEKVLENAIKRVPMKKLGDPTSVAKTIVDLCSENTNYISGQVIRINGMMYV